jgi:hypothetical protein
MNSEVKKFIDDLIKEGSAYRGDYKFLDYAMWKNKVGLLLKELEGKSYAKVFFDCFKGHEKEYREELSKTDDCPDSLFRLILYCHEKDLQRVLDLLNSLKSNLSSYEVGRAKASS